MSEEEGAYSQEEEYAEEECDQEIHKMIQNIEKNVTEVDSLNKEVTAKMAQIDNIRLEINEILLNIQLVKNDCEILSRVIEHVETAPPLLDPAPASGRSSRSSRGSRKSQTDSEDTLLQKHALKIDGKVKEVNRLIKEGDRIHRETDDWEEKLQLLLKDECNIHRRIITAENEIREYQLFSEQNAREMAFLREKISEHKKELRDMQKLRADAQKALDMLKERENALDKGTEIMDLQKTVESRQKELLKLESDIAVVRKRIYEFREYAAKESEKMQSDIQFNEESADWLVEKQTLEQTLSELKKEAQSLKRELLEKRAANKTAPKKDRNDPLTFEERTKYGWLIRKWGPDPSATEKTGKLDEIWDDVLAPRIDLAQMVLTNNKHAKKVEQARTALEWRVERFHAREDRLINRCREKQEQFENEEKVLLQKIKKFKMKLAQMRWDKHRQEM